MFHACVASSMAASQTSMRVATNAVPNHPTSSACAFTQDSRAHHRASGPCSSASSIACTRASSSGESDMRTIACARASSTSSTSMPMATHESIGATAAIARARVCAMEMRGAALHDGCGRPRSSRSTLRVAPSLSPPATSAPCSARRPAVKPVRLGVERNDSANARSSAGNVASSSARRFACSRLAVKRSYLFSRLVSPQISSMPSMPTSPRSSPRTSLTTSPPIAHRAAKPSAPRSRATPAPHRLRSCEMVSREDLHRSRRNNRAHQIRPRRRGCHATLQM